MSDHVTGWHNLPLGQLFTKLVNGGTPSTAISTYWNGKTPWVTGADFTSNGIGEIRRYVSEIGISSSSTSVVEPGNILLVTRTGVGKLAIAKQAIAISQDITGVYVDKKQLGVEFAYYLLAAELENLKKLNQGTSINGIIRADLERHKVSIPIGIGHQQKIADILQTIDRAIEQTEALIDKYQQVKAGLMHDLFTRGIGPDGQLRPPREQAPHLYQQTPIGWIPKEWEIVTIDNLAAPIKGATVIGPFGSDLVITDYKSEGVPVVFVRDVKQNGFHWVSNVYVSERKAQRLFSHRVNSGDILITKMGLPPCVSAVYPLDLIMGIITADIIRMTVDTNKVDPHWLSMSINQERTKRQVAAITAGVTRPKVTLSDFRKLEIATPTKYEQLAIKTILDRHSKLLESERKKKDNLAKQKAGLMNDLLTRKVSVTINSAAVDA